MLSKIIERIHELKSGDPKKYRVLLCLVVAAALFLFYMIGIFVQTKEHLFDFNYDFSYNLFVCLAYGLFSKLGWCIFALIVGAAILIIALIEPKRHLINPAADTDESGVTMKEYATHGGAHKVLRDEAEEYYQVNDIKKVTGIIFGQFGQNGKDVCAMDAKDDDNRNIAIIGAPGTGKSFAVIRPAILQCMKSGQSMVVMDPKGELFRDLHKKFERNGYINKLYNLVETEHSDSWDCLSECFDENGDIETARVNEYVDTIMKNTSDENKGDTFWESGETNLLTMHVRYVLERFMEHVNNGYKQAIRRALHIQPEYLDEYKMPYLRQRFLVWKYSSELSKVIRKVMYYRDNFREEGKKGVTYKADEINRMIRKIEQCIDREEMFTPHGRRNAKKKLQDHFKGMERDTYIPVFLEWYIEVLCDSDDSIWEFGRENCLKWCNAKGDGLETESRLSKRKIFRELMEASNATPSETESIIDTIEEGEDTPICNMGEVYYRLIHCSLLDLQADFELFPDSSPAKIAYMNFAKAGQKAQEGFQQGLYTRLSLFRDDSIRRITCNKDIEFARMGDEKTIIFVKTSDLSSSNQVLISLFFSFLIRDLANAYDVSDHQEKKLAVTLFMDEFKNCGRIPNIPTAITSVRGRKIAIVLAIQDKGQVETVYGETDGNTILGACDYIVFLGTNDQKTSEYISTRCGIGTVETVSEHREEAGIGFRSRYSSSITVGEAARNIYNLDEVYTLKQRRLILIKRGQYACELNTFPWVLHPEANGGQMQMSNTAHYTTVGEKYPLYDYCYDAFLSKEKSMDAVRKEKNIHLPKANTAEIIQKVSKRLPQFGSDKMDDFEKIAPEQVESLYFAEEEEVEFPEEAIMPNPEEEEISFPEEVCEEPPLENPVPESERYIRQDGGPETVEMPGPLQRKTRKRAASPRTNKFKDLS